MAPPHRTYARAALALALALTAVSCKGPLSLSNGEWQFTGTVRTLSGAAITGADLVVLNGPNQGVEVTTDAAGHYVFPRLESGRFTMTIDAPGFVRVNPIVDLYHDLDVTFALRTTP
jgi:hypothetical protein